MRVQSFLYVTFLFSVNVPHLLNTLTSSRNFSPSSDTLSFLVLIGLWHLSRGSFEIMSHLYDFGIQALRAWWTRPEELTTTATRIVGRIQPEAGGAASPIARGIVPATGNYMENVATRRRITWDSDTVAEVETERTIDWKGDPMVVFAINQARDRREEADFTCAFNARWPMSVTEQPEVMKVDYQSFALHSDRGNMLEPRITEEVTIKMTVQYRYDLPFTFDVKFTRFGSFRLLELPVELRNMVYEYFFLGLFPKKVLRHISPERANGFTTIPAYTSSAALLATSRQINSEASAVLYKACTLWPRNFNSLLTFLRDDLEKPACWLEKICIDIDEYDMLVRRLPELGNLLINAAKLKSVRIRYTAVDRLHLRMDGKKFVLNKGNNVKDYIALWTNCRVGQIPEHLIYQWMKVSVPWLVQAKKKDIRFGRNVDAQIEAWLRAEINDVCSLTTYDPLHYDPSVGGGQ